MTDKKYCQCCGILISDLATADYYSHIRIKYCSTCKVTMSDIHNRQRQREYRQRQKQIRQLKDDRIELLRKENELLRQRLADLMTVKQLE